LPSTLSTERDGRVLWVTLANPPRNFMDRHMVAELDELTCELEGDGSIGAVVITGGIEGSFVTHYDVGEILAGAESAPGMPTRAITGALRAVGAISRLPGAEDALVRTPAAGLVELMRLHEVFTRMNRLDKVFIAAVNGMATGGGCELALACDIRLMARGEHGIGQPEIFLGLIPGGGGTQRLTRLLGAGRALELVLEGGGLTPDEAAAIGLVNRVVAPSELRSEAAATARRLAARSPLSVRMAKRAVYEGGSESLEHGLHQERTGFMATAQDPAAARAMRTYLDELERTPEADLVPFRDPDRRRAWEQGEVVDLINA
jgi:enoyl-CoA hydratase